MLNVSSSLFQIKIRLVKGCSLGHEKTDDLVEEGVSVLRCIYN